MNLDEILQAQQHDLEQEFADHDPAAFTRRLAERIAEEPPRPARETTSRAGRTPGSPQPPAAPRTPRGRNRRTPPTAPPSRSELGRDLDRLCRSLLADSQLHRLSTFGEDLNEVGARLFGCLLHQLNRPQGAQIWWQFAAGAGDRLAAQCLALQHASHGDDTDAGAWRTFAHTLHTPTTVPAPAGSSSSMWGTEAAFDVARTLSGPHSDALRTFVTGSSPATAARTPYPSSRSALRSVRGNRRGSVIRS